MRVLHLGDLHIGKRVNGFLMLEDQRYILEQILTIIDEEKPQAVLIAGDVYDRNVPSEEAVELLDEFLVELANRRLQVCIISGNHDSAERIAFGSRLMDARGIHTAPVYHGIIEALTLEDEFGPVDIWMIPFLKPTHVRRFYPEKEIVSYTDAMGVVLRDLQLDPVRRNIAVVHQFIVGGSVSDSEDKQTVGGTEAIEADLFKDMDYVALGHLHGPQHIQRETIRYSGSPLKYSFSEAEQKKSVTIIDLREKGEVSVRLIPLIPLRDLVRIRGSFTEIMDREHDREDYYEITLTDEEDIPNALTKLRTVYPHLMLLRYDNTRTRTVSEIHVVEDIEQKNDGELFEELFRRQYGRAMSEEQIEFLKNLMEELGGADQ